MQDTGKQDQTPSRSVEDEIRARENYLRTIMDNVVDAIITIDDHGRIESFNHAAERLFGYHESDMLGRNVSSLMPEPYRSQHDGYLAHHMATGQARIIGKGREVEGQRADGHVFQMELQVSSLTYAGERRFIGVVRDITERKRVERMKDEFVSTVSHELRTPLTAIAGSLGLIMTGALGGVPEELAPVLDMAQRNSHRLSRLIDDLLDMERLVSGKLVFNMTTQPLMPLVREALEMNQSYAEQHQVRLELGNMHDCLVCVDEIRLQQVLSNFLSNAAKFSPPGDVVTVTISRPSPDKVRITVSDNGPGIPESFRTRIFTKFSQGDASDTRQKGGTGLGLAISKELVERMAGSVSFSSIEGRGANFMADFPLAH